MIEPFFPCYKSLLFDEVVLACRVISNQACGLTRFCRLEVFEPRRPLSSTFGSSRFSWKVIPEIFAQKLMSYVGGSYGYVTARRVSAFWLNPRYRCFRSRRSLALIMVFGSHSTLKDVRLPVWYHFTDAAVVLDCAMSASSSALHNGNHCFCACPVQIRTASRPIG